MSWWRDLGSSGDSQARILGLSLVTVKLIVVFKDPILLLNS